MEVVFQARLPLCTKRCMIVYQTLQIFCYIQWAIMRLIDKNKTLQQQNCNIK